MTQAGAIYRFGSFVLDSGRRLLLRDGEPVPLTPKAFDVLRLLVDRGGQVVAKETLLSAVWPDTVVEESNLAFQISVVRKALGEAERGRYIATVPGVGYQFVTTVQPAVHTTAVVMEERATTSVTVEEETPERVRPRRLRLAAVVALVLLVAAGAAFLLTHRPNKVEKMRVAVPAPIHTVAVVPFKPLVELERDEALELGMADSLIAKISAINGIIVRPLTAVRGYGGVHQDPVAAGRELRVDAVLDGSIHRQNDRVRVTARLLRVSDSVQLWEGRFDENLSEIFALQDAISARLVEQLELELTSSDVRRMRRHVTHNVEAYRAYSLARLHMIRIRSDQLREAIRHFEHAIELDPGFAAAWAGLANCHVTLPISSDTKSANHFARGRAAAEKAIALDPQNAQAHAALGMERFWYSWDWKGAEAELRRAVELDPGDASSRIQLAHLLSNTGRHAEARAEARRAQRIDPLSLRVNTLSAQFALQAGDTRDAIAQLQQTLAADPDFWIARLNLGKAYEMEKRYDEAIVEYRRSLAGAGESLEPLAMIGYTEALRGRKEEAEKVLAQLLATAKQRHVPPTKLALVYLGLERRDESFHWLREACAQRDVGLTFLDANPRWRRLADDPRFAEIARCVGLPQFEALVNAPAAGASER